MYQRIKIKLMNHHDHLNYLKVLLLHILIQKHDEMKPDEAEKIFFFNFYLIFSKIERKLTGQLSMSLKISNIAN